MSYLLYYSPDSANLVIRMILEELGAHYDDSEVPRRRSERDATFLRLNPRGLLPVLIDKANDTVLFETGAIALYLADRHDTLAPSAEAVGHQKAQARASCLKWLFMLSNTLHADLRLCFYSERYVTQPSEITPLRAVMAKRILGHLSLLEEMLAEHGGDHLLPWGLSICDFYLGCCLRWSQLYPAGHTPMSADEVERFPNLTRLLAGLQQRPSVMRALHREGISGDAFIAPTARLPSRLPDAVGAAAT